MFVYKPTLLALALALAGCGMDVLYVEAAAEEVCLTEMIVELDAAGGEGFVDSVIQENLDFDLPEQLSADVNLLGVDIIPYDGIADFEFIERVHIALAGIHPDRRLEPVTLVDFQRSAEPAVRLSIEGDALTNLVDYLQADVIELDVEFSGSLPTTDWSVLLDTCFAVAGSYTQSLPE